MDIFPHCRPLSCIFVGLSLLQYIHEIFLLTKNGDIYDFVLNDIS